MGDFYDGYYLLLHTDIENNEVVKFIVFTTNPVQFYLIVNDVEDFEKIDVQFSGKQWTLAKYQLTKDDLTKLDMFKITPTMFEQSGLSISWKFGTAFGRAIAFARILFDHIKETHQSDGTDSPVMTNIFDLEPIEAQNKSDTLTEVKLYEQQKLSTLISSIKQEPNSPKGYDKQTFLKSLSLVERKTTTPVNPKEATLSSKQTNSNLIKKGKNSFF